MAQEHNLKARVEAGRVAVVMAERAGADLAPDLLLGTMAGFLIACGEVAGWDAAFAEVNRIARAARAPADRATPVLKVVNGGIG